MRKEELRNLKRINATPAMVQLAKNNNKKMQYKTQYGGCIERNTVYDIMVHCQTRGKYLMVCVFLPEQVERGELAPAYEIYCNPEGDEYITRILINGKEHKWSRAMADNIKRIGNAIWEDSRNEMKQRIWQNPEGKKTIQQFLETRENGIFGLVEWQRKTRDRRIREAEERQQAPWDADMKLIPKILPSFKDWMLKEAVEEYFIFYEYSKKGAVEGYCSHCGKTVPVEKPKHNKIVRCPKCGVKAKCKVTSKIKTLGTKEYKGQVIQKIKGGVVIRGFKQRQWYRDCDYRTPRNYMNEYERILLFDNGITKRYEYGLYKNKKHRWIADNNYIQTAGTDYRQETAGKLYRRNLASIKKTALKNSAIDLWDTLPTDTARYLAIENGNPAVEKLARIGMFTLATDLIKTGYELKLLVQEATELTRMLRIDAARLRRLKTIDGKVAHLKWYQYEKTMDTVWSDEMIKDFGNAGFDTSSFNFLPAPISYVKIWNYLKKQKGLSGESMNHLKKTWKDYLNMAEKAKFNIKSEIIWKPKDLKAAHQEVVLILQSGEMEKKAKELEQKWTKVNSVLPKLQKFEYSDDKYAILAPKGMIDIVREGTALQHCVHTCDFYFDRIERDESYLFFLRRAEHKDIPWYTLEVEPSGNIRQKRTTGDNQNKDFEEAVKFLKKWQKVFRKRMTEEEKKLGVKANQARLEEYKKLREDGNRVWHGKLAGQLLADVLENDFMGVEEIQEVI